MVTDFQERLRQIREAKDLETQQQREASTAADQARLSRMEMRLERREQLEAIIEEYSANFITELPTFTRSKSFFEGKYQFEIHNDEVLVGDQGHLSKFFSRLTFLLDLKPDTNVIQVQVKKTVVNGDRDAAAIDLDFTTPDLGRFRTFVEERFFEFAGDYFACVKRRAGKPVAS